MTYELKDPCWIILFKWQTLIAGVLALCAGVGTVVATIRSANREIAAAQRQTEVAREQIDATKRIERRRIASDSYAFLAAMQATMESVLEDVDAAKATLSREQSTEQWTRDAYLIRQQVKKIAFEELRGASFRLGGNLTTPFLRLEKKIDDLAGKWMDMPTGRDPIRFGDADGLEEELDSIALQAAALRDEAAVGMKRCTAELLEPEVPAS